MRYFGSNPMFSCFDDCLIWFSHCFKLFIICLFHVRLSQRNADMKMFKPFCRLSIRSTHCSKGNEDCFVLMPICFIGAKVSHFDAHCSKAFEKRCICNLPTWSYITKEFQITIDLFVWHHSDQPTTRRTALFVFITARRDIWRLDRKLSDNECYSKYYTKENN